MIPYQSSLTQISEIMFENSVQTWDKSWQYGSMSIPGVKNLRSDAEGQTLKVNAWRSDLEGQTLIFNEKG